MRDFYKAPALIDISITNRCNLHCNFCYASSSPYESKEKEVSFKRLKKLFKELSEMNIHRISLEEFKETYLDFLNNNVFTKYVNIVILLNNLNGKEEAKNEE